MANNNNKNNNNNSNNNNNHNYNSDYEFSDDDEWLCNLRPSLESCDELFDSDNWLTNSFINKKEKSKKRPHETSEEEDSSDSEGEFEFSDAEWLDNLSPPNPSDPFAGPSTSTSASTSNKRPRSNSDSEADDETDAEHQQQNSIASLINIYGADGTNKVAALPRRKRKKTLHNTSISDQSGGRIPPQPTPSTSRAPPSSSRPLFEITAQHECPIIEHPRYKRYQMTTLMEIKHNLERKDIVLGIDTEVENFFERLMQPYLNKCKSGEDRIIVSLQFEQLLSQLFIWCMRKNFDKRALSKQLYQLAQSKRGNFLDGTLKVRVSIVDMETPLRGSGSWNKNRSIKLPDEKSHLKRSIVQVYNSKGDNSCGFIAVAIASYHLLKILLNAASRQEEEEDNFEGDILEDLETLNKITSSSFANMKEINKNWRNMRDPTYRMQRDSANIIREQAGISINDSMSLENIPLAERAIGGIKIVVVNRQTRQREYPLSMSEIPAKYICLEYIPKCREYPEGHYNALLNLNGYMEYTNFCVRCWVGTARKEIAHNCTIDFCPLCFKPHEVPLVSEAIECSTCHTIFSSSYCYDQHKINKRCALLHHCTRCKVRYLPSAPHDCLTYKCQRCLAIYTESPHYCNIKSLKLETLRKGDMKPRIIIAYDIESQLQTSTMEHKPMLLVAKRTCTHFEKNESEREAARIREYTKSEQEHMQLSLRTNPDLDLDLYAPCGLCKEEKRHWFLGKDNCTNVIHSFIEYLDEVSAQAAKVKGSVVVFAHNGQGYDCHFILRELVNLGYKGMDPIMAGSNIMKLELNNISFIDSLNFFQLPLKALPKAFGLRQELKKGDFPHKYNTEDNFHTVKPWPAEVYYEIEKKSPSDAAALSAFVAEMRTSGKMFDFDKEILEYCSLDVDILLESVLAFRKQFVDNVEIDPLTRCFTLASIALETFKCIFYKDEITPIGITPQTYTEPKNHSTVADSWLDVVKEDTNSSFFRREQRIGTKWVDGAILPLKKAYEFNGCFFHGCNKCFPDRDLALPCGEESMADRFKAWQEKHAYLENLGFDVMVKWEHELAEERRNDEILDGALKLRQSYYKLLKRIGHISPRDALFGGRTNNIKFHHMADGINSWIRYLDFTSLYPWVLSKFEYPLGHPRVVNDNFDLTMSFTGLSKCKVLPPKQLRFGVLPMRLSPPEKSSSRSRRQRLEDNPNQFQHQKSRGDERLVFPLCLSCAKRANKKTCKHTDRRRYITGTWTTPELRLAIKEGYKIIKVYEELRYERAQKGVFTEYIKLWLKEKQEASGWPSQCGTEDSKQEYIRKYQDREGIELDYTKIEKNPGRRTIAKLMLNSLWGKFAQRNNMGQTQIITTPEEYFRIIADPSKEITADEMLNQDTALVSWKFVEDKFSDLGNTSVIIASFVTSYARIELFKKLKEIESHNYGRVLYFDTDSIIFTHTENDPEVSDTGDYLGQLTDEIAKDYGDNAKCVEFVSGGPKNYALKIRLPDSTEKVVIKAKGITLNQETSEIITFSLMKEMVQAYFRPNNPQQTVVTVNQFQIRANIKQMCVRSRYFEKIYRVVSEKRRIIGNDTVPFGYVD